MIENPTVSNASIQGAELGLYLRDSHWRRQVEVKGRLERWLAPRQAATVLIPLNPSAPDYVELLTIAIDTIASCVALAAADLIRQILQRRSDVIRLTADVAIAPDGSVPLDEALRLIRSGYEMVEASALARIEPRAYWVGHRPDQAYTFMRSVRIGLTRPGSYVVPVVVPLPSPDQTGLAMQNEDPFERLVTRTVVAALDAAITAARDSAASDFRPFLAAIARGVNANLCDAIGDLIEIPDLESLRVEASWSESAGLSAPAGTKSSVVIPRELLPQFRAAATFLRPKELPREVRIVGVIEHLDRAENENEGTIGIKARVDDEQRMLYVDLPLDTYLEAVRAHERSALVACTGTLVRQGRRRSLDPVERFDVLETLDIPSSSS